MDQNLPTEQDFQQGLKGLELAGITCIRGYWQFLFDGPVLTVASRLRAYGNGRSYQTGTPGLCDFLCSQHGQSVTEVFYVPEAYLRIAFANGVTIEACLTIDDYVGEEAVLFDPGDGGTLLVV